MLALDSEKDDQREERSENGITANGVWRAAYVLEAVPVLCSPVPVLAGTNAGYHSH